MNTWPFPIFFGVPINLCNCSTDLKKIMWGIKPIKSELSPVATAKISFTAVMSTCPTKHPTEDNALLGSKPGADELCLRVKWRSGRYEQMLYMTLYTIYILHTIYIYTHISTIYIIYTWLLKYIDTINIYIYIIYIWCKWRFIAGKLIDFIGAFSTHVWWRNSRIVQSMIWAAHLTISVIP